PGRLAAREIHAGHRGREVVGDPRQVAVFQRVDGGSRSGIEPDRGTDAPEGSGPPGAQPAASKRRLRLPAAVAPGRSDGPPAVTAHVTDESIGISEREQGLAQETFGRKDELFDRFKPPGHGAPPRASPRAAPPDPERTARRRLPPDARGPLGRPPRARPPRGACGPSASRPERTPDRAPPSREAAMRGRDRGGADRRP